MTTSETVKQRFYVNQGRIEKTGKLGPVENLLWSSVEKLLHQDRTTGTYVGLREGLQK